MKNLNCLFVAVAVVALTGCLKETEKQEILPGTQEVKLRVDVNEPETKVSIDNAYAFAFQAGDVISVINSEGEPVEFATTTGGTSVDFTGTLPTGETVGAYAMYPANTDHLADGNELLFAIPGEITWKTDESYMPMLGKINNGSATFKAVGGVMKLIVYNIPISADYLLFSTNGQKISGVFTIADASVATPVITTGTGSGDESELLIGFANDYSVNKVFYIPLPTGTINGFSIEFLDDTMDVISGASKTTTATLNITRNRIIIAPALNMAPATEVVLWSEDFSQYSANDVPHGAQGVGYNNAKIAYSVEDGGGTTTIFNDNLAHGTAPEILVAKKGGSFTADGIPSAGATTATISYCTNNDYNIVSTATAGVTIGSRSKNGNVVTYPITIPSSVQSFNLCISNSNKNNNTRIDNIVVKGVVGTAPNLPTISTNKESETIGAGSLNASINGVTLANALDNLGISATTTADWLEVAFTEGDFATGAKLTATATSYHHGAFAREATVTLKATGATKTVTFKQNPSVVNNPSSLTVVSGDKTFTVSWTGDSKVDSYVAYYSTTELSDPTTGTALTVSHQDNTYSAVPSVDLLNRTTYYVYVKAATLTSQYADKYAISDVWAETTAVPVGEIAVQTVSAPYSQMFKTDGQGAFVIDVHDDGGSDSDIWAHDSSYGMVAYGKVGSTNYNTEAWLLSPKITIASSITNPYVSFKHTGNNFSNVTNVRTDVPIYIREEGGAWEQLNVPYPDGNNWTFVTVDYSLISYIGKTVQFAWAYTSSTNRCGKYELDEFKVYDKPSGGDNNPVELTFDLTNNPGNWPTTNPSTLTDYSYQLDGVDYTFKLKNVKQNNGYLMCTSTAVLGLPALSGYKLTKVIAHNSSGCSTSTKVGVSSSATSATYISGGAIQTWSTTDSDYSYSLAGTSSNTVYYLYITNKNAQITSLKLTYTPDN